MALSWPGYGEIAVDKLNLQQARSGCDKQADFATDRSILPWISSWRHKQADIVSEAP
jgi:hypothetical protein